MSVLPSDIRYYGSLCMPAFDGASTLNGALSDTTGTSVAIALPTSPFPASGEFAIQVDSEIMWVTQGAPGNAAGTLTVIRGFAGSTAATHSNAAAVTMPAGKGIDLQTKVFFSDVVSGHTTDIVSSSASDTKVKIQSCGRDTAGVIQTETLTINGTTIVTGSQAYDRLEFGRIAAVTTSTNNPLTAGGTTLTVTTAANLPASGNYYVQMGKEIMQVTAGQGTGSLTVTRGVLGSTATAHANLDNIYLLPLGDIALVDHTKIITNHTCQTGSANSTGTTPALAKLQSGDGASVSVGQIIRTQGGTGPNQIRTIIAVTGYGTDIVAVSRDWTSVPDNTTTYDVWNGVQLDLSPNQICEARRFLWNAAADAPGGSQRIFYQKIFAMNDNTTTALTAATVQDVSNTPTLPAGALLDLATATAAADTVGWATRQTVPGSGYGSYSTQPLATAYGANSGNLAGGSAPNSSNAQGIVLRTTLPAGTTVYKGAALLRTSGTTT